LTTSIVTGRHRGRYRAPSLKRTSHMLRCVFIVECGIARFLCSMHDFEVRPSSLSSGLPLCQISFLSRPPLPS